MNKVQGKVEMWVVLVALAAIATLVPIQLRAQTFFGSVVGSVTDSSGAVIPGATVTIANLGTNESRTVTTGASGDFRFVNLVPANYKVTVEAANFKRTVRQPVTVAVDNTTRVDAVMTVGSATETVEVTTQVPLLTTDSGSQANQVEGKTVAEMPLNGRNPLNLIALSAGVIPGNNTMGAASTNNGPGGGVNTHTTASWNNFIIGGGLGGTNAEYIDGVSEDMLTNVPALVPTQDAVQEFKLATGAVSAEFGSFSGGVTELTTKSGSNQWHGSAYEYVRNKYFNANFFFNKYNGRVRPEWNQNQFGVVASGPVIKDKVFALFTWEHFSSRQGVPAQYNTPTAAMQAGYIPGDLSTNSIVRALCPTASYNTSTQYPNTTYLPSSCWDTTSNVLKAAFPAPMNTSVAVGSGNYFVSPVVGNTQNQYSGRVDWAISDKQRLFGRYTYWPLEDTPQDIYGSAGGFKTGNAFTQESTHMAVLGDTYTFNPTTILDLRLGYVRYKYNAYPPNGGHIDMAPYGAAWVALAPQMTYTEYPGIHVSGKYNFYNMRPMDDTAFTTYNNYSIAASMTKIWNKHTMKLGTELRLMDEIQLGLTTQDPSGSFSFSNSPTLIPDEWAAFLLGYAANGAIHTASTVGAYKYLQGYYVTDDWVVKSKLTLNLGIRYDLPGAVSERKNKSTVLLPSTKDPYTGVTGTLALVNSSLYAPRTTQYVSHSQIQPRLGFAYRLNSNTTIRGGYGLMYTPGNVGGATPISSPVGKAGTNWVNTGAAPYHLLANPFPTTYFPNGINKPAGRSDPAFMKSYLGQSVSGPIPDAPYSYAQQWSLSAGRQLKDNLMVEAAYVGSKGTHLPSAGSWGIDELSSQYYAALSAMLVGFGPTPTSAQIASLTALGQSERPYPSYQNLINTLANFSSSTYHSLQTKVEKRFRSGGLISASYTWSKNLSDSNVFANGNAVVQDYNNRKGERSVTTSNTPNRAVVSYVLNLPFGKGAKWASNVHGVAGAAISGWAVNGITTFQSGWPLPLQATGNYLSNNWGAGTIRPNFTAGCNKAVSGSRYERFIKKQWFNTSCFTQPGSISFGNQVKLDDKIRQQGIDNWDLTIAKTTTLHESMNLVFKAEFFNIFNHPQFAAPGAALGGGTTSSGGTGSAFGAISYTANTPRLAQLSLRLNY